jgi:hypothetical protein
MKEIDRELTAIDIRNLELAEEKRRKRNAKRRYWAIRCGLLKGEITGETT